MHSLEIVQWDSTRRDHPGYPGRVSGSGLVTDTSRRLLLHFILFYLTFNFQTLNPPVFTKTLKIQIEFTILNQL